MGRIAMVNMIVLIFLYIIGDKKLCVVVIITPHFVVIMISYPIRPWNLASDISVQIAILKYALHLLMPIGPVGIVQRFVSPHTGLILIGQDMINGHPILGRLPLYPWTSGYGRILPDRAIQINKNVR